jgi:peptidoglycan hydrolase-like protein with peptidoglycan-binding domain
MTPTTFLTRTAVALCIGATAALAVSATPVRAADSSQASTQGGPAMPRRGDSGPSVVRLQQALAARGIAVAGGITGLFGEGTAAAVATLQRQSGLRASGKVDARTAKILGLAPTVTVTTENLPTFGTSGDVVWLVQAALQELGVRGAGEPDGQFGVATRTAIASFQSSRGLRSNGLVDEPTAAALGLIAAPQVVKVVASASPSSKQNRGASGTLPSYGERSSAVTTLQQQLIAAGFAIDGGATGYFGPRTKQAIEALQKSKGMKVTGVVDVATLAALAPAAAAPAPSAPAAPAPSAAAPASIPSLAAFPMQGRCWFGDTWLHPRSGGRKHEGTDLIGAAGLAIYAVANGVITRTYDGLALGGKSLRLTAPDGTYYFYAHLDSFAPGIGAGTAVRAGQIIGYNGATGNAHEPHLHFEIHPGGGDAVNPYPFLKAIDGCRNTALLPQ